jgi:recombination protein RecA
MTAVPATRPSLDKIVADLNKKLGANTVVLASKAAAPVPRIPSGSLTLDYILGGGWPANQWVELIGEASSGKTALALHTIAANQKADPEFTAVWIAAEKWVSQYAEMCGVDCDRVYVVENNIMEDALDAVLKFAESRQVDLIVIDSLPALVPTAEDDKAMEEMTVGRHALLINRFFRKVGKATKRSLVDEDRPVMGLVINQWRMKIDGNSKYDNRTTPGGEGKNYSFFIRVELRRSGWIDVGSGVDQRRVGQTVRARTLKNKTAPAQQTADWDFYFDEGGECAKGDIDFAKELIALGVATGVIERKAAWLFYMDRKWQGGDQMLASLREEIDLAESLTKEVMATLERP